VERLKGRDMKYISIVLISILLVGCAGIQTPPINPTSVAILTTPTAKLTITVVATVTPNINIVPILPFEEARQQSIILLETNNNCQLPCWWGVHPSVTTWEEVAKTLGSLSTGCCISYPIFEDGLVYINPPTPNDEHGKVLFHTYYLEKGIVKSMVIYNFDFAPMTHFNNIIANFGIPKEMYIRGHQDEGFRLVLFYPEQGILAEYSRTITSSTQENVKVCYQDANSPFLYLWKPNYPMSFEEAIVYLHVPTEDIPEFMPIEESLTNLNEFIESLGKLKGNMCIETPKDLWPTKY